TDVKGGTFPRPGVFYAKAIDLNALDRLGSIVAAKIALGLTELPDPERDGRTTYPLVSGPTLGQGPVIRPGGIPFCSTESGR
ncbi:MAG TPA: hypothetical protein V6D27_02110, partial [Vampirovibrionales bacterium]